MADVAIPGSGTLLVDANPTQTGPLSPSSVRADGGAVLISSWSAVADGYQIDLAEIVAGPGEMLTAVSGPPPAGASTNSLGDYDADGDAVIYQVLQSLAPSRLMEAHRGSYANPTQLGSPGRIFSFRLSPDDLVVCVSYGPPELISTRINLINRAAPETMMRLNAGGSADETIVAVVSGT